MPQLTNANFVWTLCPDFTLKNTIKFANNVSAAAYSPDKKTFALAKASKYVVRDPPCLSLVRRRCTSSLSLPNRGACLDFTLQVR